MEEKSSPTKKPNSYPTFMKFDRPNKKHYDLVKRLRELVVLNTTQGLYYDPVYTYRPLKTEDIKKAKNKYKEIIGILKT